MMIIDIARLLVLGSDGMRLDSREPRHIQLAFLRTRVVSAALGSAYTEFGSTKVMVFVYGPRKSKKAQVFNDIGRLNYDMKFASFATNMQGQAK